MDNIGIVELLIALVVQTGFLTWIGNLISQRNISRLQHKNEKEILSLKSEIERNLFSTQEAFKNLSASNTISHKNRIEAVEKLWENLLDVKEFCGSSAFFYSVLRDDEYKSAFEKSTVFNVSLLNLDQSHITDFAEKDESEKLRIYVGGKLWEIYSAFLATNMRLLAFVIEQKNGGKVYNPKEDEELINVIKKVLSEEEIQELTSKNNFDMYMVNEKFQNKFLETAHRVITGEAFVIDSFRSSTRIQEEMNMSTVMFRLRDNNVRED